MICSARCSALVRDRPMVVMTLRLPRWSRMSQACQGGRPRELAEPVSIWTVTVHPAGVVAAARPPADGSLRPDLRVAAVCQAEREGRG